MILLHKIKFMKTQSFSIYTILLIALFFFQLTACKNENNKELDILENETEELDSFTVLEEDGNSTDINELVKSKDESQLNESQLVIQNLLKYCAEDKMESASKIIAYIGEDENRLYKDHFNYGNASEKSIVKITCDVINKWLKESATYEFISYDFQPSEIGNVHSVEVMFQKQGVGVNRKFFRLVNSKKGLILVSID